jgi:hypothetical protein
MQDKRAITDVEMEHQGFKIGDMMLQAIRVRGERHTGLPHAHMIRDDTTSMPRERWDELAIQIAPGRVPMHEDYGFSLALIDIVQLYTLLT